MRADAPPRWVRACVWTFLAVFVGCAVGRVEAWPFTGWQLFSHARTELQRGWTATVETQGVEIALADALPGSAYLSGRGAYRGLTQTLQRFERYTPARRSAVCLAWHARAAQADRDGPLIRIYRTQVHVGDRVGVRGAPAVRALAFTCDQRGIVEVTR